MGDNVEKTGFAKLQGEDFEYYMQTYYVDLDLFSPGSGMNIIQSYARIFYDFQLRHFSLEVLGKNGCFVNGVLHLPGNPPIKLHSQDQLRIGDKEIYFLVPVKSILSDPVTDVGVSRRSSRNVALPPTAVLRYGEKGKGGGEDGLVDGSGGGGGYGYPSVGKAVGVGNAKACKETRHFPPIQPMKTPLPTPMPADPREDNDEKKEKEYENSEDELPQ